MTSRSKAELSGDSLCMFTTNTLNRSITSVEANHVNLVPLNHLRDSCSKYLWPPYEGVEQYPLQLTHDRESILPD